MAVDSAPAAIQDDEPAQDGTADDRTAHPVEPAASSGGAGAKSHVTTLEREGRTFHLVGTAHVSRRSVEEVEAVIERTRPDTVCVELCKTRFEALTDTNRWRKLDIFQVIRQKKTLFLLANLALQGFQRRLGKKLGVQPGEELLTAVRTARRVGAEVVLADRDIQATLRRTWANLSLWNRAKLVSGLLVAAFDREQIDEEQVEALKERDVISEMLGELAKLMPEIKEPLIDERDAYLMSAVEDAPGTHVVAVVGAGHVEGMVARFGTPADREALSRIPPAGKLATVVGWMIPAVILAAFYWGYRQHAGEGLVQMLLAWVIPTAVGGALGTLLGGGKLLSVLAAGVSSPLTTLNPTIGVGMVVGLTEAWLRRPTVEHCEQLNDDIVSLRGLFRNPFSRILIVALTASLGAILGVAVGASWVLALL